LFAEWTPDERWLAGLLWADGHLLVNDPYAYIQLNLVDEQALTAAAAVAGRGYSTGRAFPRKGGGMYKPLHRMSITDADACGRLAALGFGPKADRSWPGQLASGAFLRGLFDGDGSACFRTDNGRRYLQTKLCGSYAVLAGAMEWLAGQGIQPHKLGQKGGYCRVVEWHKRDSLRLAEIMYGEPGPFMVRKREVFRKGGR
jgi:hypothetical protein